MSCFVVSRAADADPACRAAEERLLAASQAAGLQPAILPHLYHLPDEAPTWPWLASLPHPLHVVSWLQPRAMQALLAAHGIAGAVCRHFAEALPLDAWMQAEVGSQAAPASPALAAELPPRWYPVLDKSRCQECRHCLDFCLFGVYELADGRVHVANPGHCKPGCPACARICGSSAIIFPLYERDPAICGAPGSFVQLTDEARALYQKRTGKSLPPAVTSAPAPAPPSPLADELDRLVAELEDFSKGRRA